MITEARRKARCRRSLWLAAVLIATAAAEVFIRSRYDGLTVVLVLVATAAMLRGLYYRKPLLMISSTRSPLTQATPLASDRHRIVGTADTDSSGRSWRSVEQALNGSDYTAFTR